MNGKIKKSRRRIADDFFLTFSVGFLFYFSLIKTPRFEEIDIKILKCLMNAETRWTKGRAGLLVSYWLAAFLANFSSSCSHIWRHGGQNHPYSSDISQWAANILKVLLEPPSRAFGWISLCVIINLAFLQQHFSDLIIKKSWT